MRNENPIDTPSLIVWLAMLLWLFVATALAAYYVIIPAMQLVLDWVIV